MTRIRRDGERKYHKVNLDEFVALAHKVQLEGLTLGPALAELSDLNVTQVRYYLRRARELGMKVDLDHTPAHAVIFRNSAQQVEWLTCRTCLVPWPCPITEHAVAVSKQTVTV